MILVDWNMVVYSSAMAGHKSVGSQLDESSLRHLVLNSLLTYKRKFKDYGEIVLCCDSVKSWRKEVFPFYKAARKKSRDESPYDWDLIFSTMDKLEEEIDTYFPYKVVKVDRAEGDDIIATLVKYYQENELVGDLMPTPQKIKIVSRDKDFRQLQIYENVSQYDPISKTELREPDPNHYLFEHILRGDGGDGVPNFLSDDDAIVADGKRQKRLTTKRVDSCWEAKDPVDFCSTQELQNYSRNKKLVDLINEIPEDIASEIIAKYEDAKVVPRSRLLSYFIKMRLKNLMESLQDF